jgi:hypothetical protein
VHHHHDVAAAGRGNGGNNGQGGNERSAKSHDILLSKRLFRPSRWFPSAMSQDSGQGMPGIEQESRSC